MPPYNKENTDESVFLTSSENNAGVMCERVRWFAFSWQDALKVSLKSWARFKSELQFQQPVPSTANGADQVRRDYTGTKQVKKQ